MATPMAMIGIGSSVIGGITGAMGAATKAQGDQINIAGQMLSTMGQAYQMDVQSAEYGTRANMSDYQAGVAQMNKKIALSQADAARASGDVEAGEKGMQWRSAISNAKAAQGASGLNVNTGSAVNVRESMIELGNFDQTTVRANAAKVAYGYDVEAAQDEAQGALYTMTAGLERMQASAATMGANITRMALPLEQQASDIAKTSGEIGVISSLVGGAGSVASKWSQASTAGALPSFMAG